AVGVCDGPAAMRLDLLDDPQGARARRVTPVDRHAVVIDHDTGARRGQAQRHSTTDAATRPRHDRHFPVQEPHGSPSAIVSAERLFDFDGGCAVSCPVWQPMPGGVSCEAVSCGPSSQLATYLVAPPTA